MKKIPVILLAALLLTLSCKKKEEPRLATPTVVLETGKGALLVVFPKRSETFSREDWMSQVHLTGAVPTENLPRIPIADLEATMILNIEPGKYEVTAQSWIRKQEQRPQFGGSYSPLEILPGQMAVLKAKPLSGESYPYPQTKMTFERSVGWSVSSPKALTDFVASVLSMSAKG